MTPADSGRVDFALLGHPSGPEHLDELILRTRPEFDREKLQKHRRTITKFFEWTPTYAAGTPIAIAQGTAHERTGRLIVCTFMPDAITSPSAMVRAYEKVRAGCALARDAGARVVGLGGFTSIVGGLRASELSVDFGIRVTSGNSLTAALAVAQVEALLGRLELSLRGLTLAVIGASGDIGGACVRALAPRMRAAILIGRNRTRLEAFRDALGADTHARTSTDVRDALDADVVVAATSTPVALVGEGDFAPGTVVCDVGYPKTLAYAVDPRPDVLTFSGGLAEIPFDLDVGYYTRLPGRLMYGCYSETMLLTMAGSGSAPSVGEARVSPESMAEALQLARGFGFRPAPPYRAAHAWTDERIDAFLPYRTVRQA